MLPEPEALLLDASEEEKLGGACDEVTERLVGDNLVSHRLANGHAHHRLALQLHGRRQHLQLHVSDGGELGKGLVAGLHEELDLRLGELALADKATSRRDLVTVALADLGDAKGHLVRVLLCTELVVEEDALRGLRAQVALEKARGPDWGGEHEVELVRFSEVVARLRRLDAVLLELATQLLLGERVSRQQILVVLGPLRLRDRRQLEAVFELLLEQLVSAEELVVLQHILDHEVVESVDVPGRLEHVMRHDGGVLDLQEILLDDEVAAPQGDQIRFERSPRGAVSVKPGCAAIDVEGRPEEEPPLADVIKLLPIGDVRVSLDRLAGLFQLLLQFGQGRYCRDEFGILLVPFLFGL
mmetsp:Transcript_70798/g.147491  ORF Transcript_70798/g.147491 Transcript_70798/m.147491 type:complete len:356 (-) Transcript_70798:96-1163(-)